MTGLYNGTGNIGGPDFPPFAGTAGRFDVSIAGLTASGDHRWSKTINTTADAFAGGIALDGAGNAFVLGHFIGTATINGAQRPSAGSWDVFLARFDDPTGTIGACFKSEARVTSAPPCSFSPEPTSSRSGLLPEPSPCQRRSPKIW